MANSGLMQRPFAHLAAAWRGLWSGPLTSKSPELARLWGGQPSSTGMQVSEQTALTYSAFWACVNAISTDVASLPLIHYKRASGGGKERYTNSKIYRMLHDEPNPEMTSITMRQTLTAHTLTWGNGYAEIERARGGHPLYLWPLTPDRVQPFRDDRGVIGYRVTNSDGSQDMVPAADMLHISGHGFDGLVGYSVVAKARESIGLGLATERFGGTFFGNGSTFGGVFEHPGRMTEPAMKNFKESINARHQGVDRAHKFLVVEEGMKYQTLGIPPNDAQFLETRLHQIEEMCRWFRMPPHKIQHLLRSTNNNIEHQGIEYYTDTLRPWCVRWEQELCRKLIPPAERRIQYIEHMIAGVLRGDLPSRYAAYAIGRQWGWLSGDDICDMENLNPLPNGQGKIYLVPLNMAPADRLNAVIDAQIKAKDAPPPAAPAPVDPNTDQDARALDAIRAAITETTERAEAHLARAVAAEADAVRWKDSADVFRGEAEAARAAAAEEMRKVAVLQALQLEAIEREARDRAEREALAATFVAASAERAAQMEGLSGRAAAAETALTRAIDDVADARRMAMQREGERDESQARVVTLEAELATTVPVAEFEARTLELSAARADLAIQTAEHGDAVAQLGNREAAVVAETDRRAAIEVELQALRDQRTADMAIATAEMTRLRAEVDAAASAQANLQIGYDSEARARIGSEQRNADAEAALSAQRAAERQRLTAVIAAHRGLIADAMGRMIRRETEKARRAQATPEKLRHWIETFYPVHEDVCRAALLPAVRTHIAWKQSSDDAAEITAGFVSQHVADSKRQLLAVLDSDPEHYAETLETTLRRWELERSDLLADVILREEIEYASRQR